MKRSELNPIPEYFDRYINKTDDVELLDAITISIKELDNIKVEKWEALGDRVYAPGKWTVRDILQHIIDTERIFTYRAMAFARGENQALPSFEEEAYAAAAKANRRTIPDLLAELRVSHQSLFAMYSSFAPAMLAMTGQGFKGKYSVASIGFILPGHQRWHLQIVKERYLTMLSES